VTKAHRLISLGRGLVTLKGPRFRCEERRISPCFFSGLRPSARMAQAVLQPLSVLYFDNQGRPHPMGREVRVESTKGVVLSHP
jgi:hypothetical protein